MWFTEDALTPCAVFGAAGLIALLSGLNAGRRGLALLGLLSLLLAGSGFVIDALVVTAREQLETSIRTLCDDFRHKRPETYNYFTKSDLKLNGQVLAAMALVDVEDEPRITDLHSTITNQGSRATSHFRANATISVKGFGNVGYQPSRFILTWAREPDGWKIIKVQRMDPLRDRELGLLDQTAH